MNARHNASSLATAIAAVIGGLAVVPGSRAAAQEPSPAVLLVLDKDALDYGPAPHFLPADAVNPSIAGVGVRDELSYFQNHLDAQVILTAGQNGNDGWFAIRTRPASWSTGESATDGLENFALAGPGLGLAGRQRRSGIAARQRAERRRRCTPTDSPLLVGRTVCAVVYSDDVVVTPGSALVRESERRDAGQRRVHGRIGDRDRQPCVPNVQVQIAEGHEVCAGQLTALSEAP